MDAAAEPAAEPAPEPAAEPAAPPLPPRMERFCRIVADGESLAEAARRAGYAPASARQRGSELWARDDVQARIAALREREEDERRALAGAMRRRYEKFVDQLDQAGRPAEAGRLLGQWWRFERDARSLSRLREHERERLRAELREEVRTELRAEMHAEVYAELREELRPAALADEYWALAKVRAERIREEAAAGRTMTNHDAAGTVSPAAAPAAPAAPAPAAPTARPQPAGRTMTNQDDPDCFEALLKAVHARPPAARPPAAQPPCARSAAP